MNSLATCHVLTPPEPREANTTDGQPSNLFHELAQYAEALSENKKATCDLMTSNKELRNSIATLTEAVLGMASGETPAQKKNCLMKMQRYREYIADFLTWIKTRQARRSAFTKVLKQLDSRFISYVLRDMVKNR